MATRILALPVFAALEVGGFRTLLAGGVLIFIARWMELAVLGWAVREMTHSPFQVALVGFYRLVPSTLLSPFGGVLADRFDRRWLMRASALLGAAASLVVALAMLAGVAQMWHIAVGLLVVGIGGAGDFPARRAYTLDLLGSERIRNGLSLDSIVSTVSRLIGPLLGGGLIPLLGTERAYLAVSGFYAAGFVPLLFLPAVQKRTAAQRSRLWRNLVEGWRYVRHSRPIMGVLAAALVMNFVFFPLPPLFPIFARDVLHVGPLLFGLLSSAQGFGSLVASGVLAALRGLPRPFLVYTAGSFLAIGGTLAFALSSWFPLSFALLVMSGIGMAIYVVLEAALIMTSASEEMRGRATATMLLAISVQPGGILLMGALASRLGAPLGVGILTAAGLAVMVVLLLRVPALRR
ncbi:MAG: MFS transporter [Chloroflexi bacterium]|nr:MFS transporter [Chloroflexota bacterium]